MNTAKSVRPLLTALALCGTVAPLHAQWTQNSTVGPSDYNNTANWNGGVINNLFTNNPTTGLNITFGADTTLSSQLTYGWPGAINVTNRSDSATPRTIKLTGGIIKTNNAGGTVVIGTAANPLVLDINGGTRAIGGGSPSGTANSTINVYAQIIDSSGKTNGVNLSANRVFTYLLNDNNSFVGPVSFAGFRGGGFSSIKPIGSGNSALGAPTDTANGTISITDNSSNGQLNYTGSGNTSDRPFVWNISFANTPWSAYAFQNTGSGKLTLSGQWTLPSAATTNTFIVNGLNNAIELDGYIKGNGGLTYLQFAGTNILGGPTNDFCWGEVTSGVLGYTTISNAGAPCSLGTNGTIFVRNGSLQYVGTNSFATNSRALQFTSPGTAWNLDNATTNTTLVISGPISGGLYPTNALSSGGLAGGTNGAGPRTLILGVLTTSDSGNSGPLLIQSAIPDLTPTNITTVVAAGAIGSAILNGGTVALLCPTNTFSGGVQVKYARTLQVTSLADSNSPCSIGLGTNPPAGTAGIIIGSSDSQRGGTLAYIGTNNTSCNRQICVEGVNFGGQSSATILNNSPNNSSLRFSYPQPVIYYSGVLISNCSFTLGGSANATNVFDLQITNTPLGSAALAVSGSTWLLTAAHSYAGATTVSGGALLVNGSIGGTGVTNTGGTLGGSGTISSPVAIQSSGTLRPGQGNGSIGTLTINNTLKLSGKTTMFINRSGSAASLVTGVSTLTYGGTLNVTNLGAALALGDTFTLFSATTYVGAFASSNLPPLAAGLKWDASQLAPGGNGTIRVICDGTLTASAGSVSPICVGASVPIGGSPTASGGSGSGYTYSWSPSDSLDNSGIAHPSASPAATTQYTVTVTDAGGCTAQSQVTVTVNPLPSTSAISGPATVCPGQTGVAYSVAATSGSTYAWSEPGGASITAGQGTSSIAVTFGSSAGNVSVVETSAAGCVGSPVSLALSLNSPPTLITDITNQTVCPGSEVTWAVVAAGTGLTYQWQRDGTNLVEGVGNFTGTMGPVLTNSAAAPEDSLAATNGYVCIVSGTCSPATNSAQAALIVTAVAVGGVAAPAASHVCAGTGTTISLSGQTGAITGWESSPDNFTVTTNEIASTADSLSTGDLTAITYYRAIVQSGTCSAALSSVAQVIPDSATAGSLVSSSNPSLPGASVTLTATVTNAVPGCLVPTGDVLFKASGVAIGAPVALDVSGMAALITSSLPHGSNSITAEYAGDSNSQGLTNSLVQVVNTPPVASNTTAGIIQNQTLVLSDSKLLASCYDADGDLLSITSAGPTSTNGGTVSLAGTNVTYQPVTNFVGTDLFTFVVSDPYGASATGTVLVTVTAASAPSPNIVSGPAILPNGHFYVGFAGIPGYTYTVQYSANADGPWTTLTNLTAGDHGLFDFEDPTEPTPPTRFYRTTYP